MNPRDKYHNVDKQHRHYEHTHTIVGTVNNTEHKVTMKISPIWTYQFSITLTLTLSVNDLLTIRLPIWRKRLRNRYTVLYWITCVHVCACVTGPQHVHCTDSEELPSDATFFVSYYVTGAAHPRSLTLQRRRRPSGRPWPGRVLGRFINDTWPAPAGPLYRPIRPRFLGWCMSSAAVA